MKLSMSVKAFALVLAMSPLAFAGSAHAYDDEDGNPVVGIIGQVIGGAIEAEQAKEAEREHRRECRRFRNKCEDGARWACRKYEESCDD